MIIDLCDVCLSRLKGRDTHTHNRLQFFSTYIYSSRQLYVIFIPVSYKRFLHFYINKKNSRWKKTNVFDFIVLWVSPDLKGKKNYINEDY